MDWQPIETAPKDGTKIIITNGEWVSEGWFSHSIWLPAKYRDSGVWCDADGRDIARELVGKHHPTHWMPFPKPPKD